MPGRGGLVAVTDEQRKRVQSANGDQQKIDALYGVIDIVRGEFQVHTDKAWDAIHRALAREDPETEELPPGSSDDPLALAIMGGKRMLEDENASAFVMRLVEPDQVPRVAEALRGVDEAAFRALYDAHCRDVEPEYDDDGLEYAWEYFQAIREFYMTIASTGRSAIFGVGI